MWTIVKRLQVLLNAKERGLSYGLLGLIVLAGLIDVLGLSSILPFMAVVGNPEVIQTNSWLHAIYAWFEFESTETFLIGLGTTALGIMVFSNAMALCSSYAILRFSNYLGYNISTKMLAEYVKKPYAYFLEVNSSDLVVNCIDDVVRVTQGIMIPLLQMIAKVVVAMSILLVVVWVDPWVAVSFGAVLGTIYAGLFLAIRNKVVDLGRAAKHANQERRRLLTEILSGIKELKILGQDHAYRERYGTHAAVYAKNQWMSSTLSQVPRYGIESIAFGSMLLLVIYLLMTHQDIKSAIPLLVLYALTGYRLIPAFQQIFASASAMRFNIPSLEAVEKKLETVAGAQVADGMPELPVNDAIGPLRQEIVLDDLTFQYANTDGPLIRNLNLTIQQNSTVAIVGSSGGGKTTLVDIILGLLEPQAGTLAVDGIPITIRNVKSWQKHLGYVPQHIYLSDDTLAANIAFGVASKDLNMDRVEEAARIANLHEFVLGELPDGYHTMVGERGVRLSGGQRQRIGIARALYSNPDVLILDEATSALDSLTEEAVTDAIQTLFHKKTVIIIAHRLKTVQAVDVIYLLENGAIADQGTYTELLAKNDMFGRMASGAI